MRIATKLPIADAQTVLANILQRCDLAPDGIRIAGKEITFVKEVELAFQAFQCMQSRVGTFPSEVTELFKNEFLEQEYAKLRKILVNEAPAPRKHASTSDKDSDSESPIEIVELVDDSADGGVF